MSRASDHMAQGPTELPRAPADSLQALVQSHGTLWLTLVNGVLSVMVSKGDLAPFPSVGVATSQLNCMEDWLMPASPHRSFMTACLGKCGSQGVTQTSG